MIRGYRLVTGELFWIGSPFPTGNCDGRPRVLVDIDIGGANNKLITLWEGGSGEDVEGMIDMQHVREVYRYVEINTGA